MNDKTYTPEEIATAWQHLDDTYPGEINIHVLLETLARPKHKFRDGEVIYKEKGSPICYFCYDQGWEWDSSNFRHLRPSEMPEWVEKKLKAAEELHGAASCALDGMDGAMTNLRLCLAKYENTDWEEE